MINRRALLGCGSGLVAAAYHPGSGLAAESAETYPSRAIWAIMPYEAGGAPDLLMRAIGSELEKRWGQPIVVEDRPGANGIIACQTVSQSRPDGYMLIMGSIATHAINATAYRKLPYKPVEGFSPITQTGQTPLIITSHPSIPATTLTELIAYTKANPGKLTYASVGQGSLGHLAAMLFQMETGTSMVHVPYRGISPGVTDLLGGVVNLAFSNVLNVLPFVRTGQLRAYGVTSAERLAILPDVPPVKDVVPNYEATLWWGLFAVAGTPRPIIDKLNGEIFRYLSAPENRARWAQQAVTLTGTTPEQFAAILSADTEKWGKVVRAAGVSL
jgi:tripartite-type tricarboxylate transporter receptor subunit TctC